MITKILIGVEDSKYAEAAAKYGFDLAKSFGAYVGLVNIIEPIAASANNYGTSEILGSPLLGLDNLNETTMINVQDQVSETIVEHFEQQYGKGLEVTRFSEYGSTGEGIITCSAEFKADLIVIGTHHRSGFDRLFSGSVAAYVVNHSEIPVLVVPGKE